MARWEASTLVRSTPDKVFEYLSNLERHAEWAGRRRLGTRRLEVVTPGPIGLGTRFRGISRLARLPGRSESVITIFERPRRLGFDTTIQLGPAKITLSHLYDLWPDGAVTRLTHRIQGPRALNLAGWGPARLWETKGWHRLQRDTAEGLEALRAAAERFARQGPRPLRRQRQRGRPVRQLVAFGLLAGAAAGYAMLARRGPAPHFHLITDWVIPAPPEEVWKLLSDSRTYPEWWSTVYLEVEVEGDGPAGVGSRAHFYTRGKLPYKLNWDVVTTEYDPPRGVAIQATGDFVGTGRWTIEPVLGGTRARLDWELVADQPAIRLLNPIARPLLEWNHRWAMDQGLAGIRSRLAVRH